VNDNGERRRSSVKEILDAIDRLDLQDSGRLSAGDEALLRSYGFYTQRPAPDGFFMVRIRIPGGDLTHAQLRVIADLGNEHGRGIIDITVRQNMQLHWVRPSSFHDIVLRLNEIGLSTTESCGDAARNIVNCPVAGVDHDELYDTTGIVRQLGSLLESNPGFSGLPRKLKITITGCPRLCVYPEISDIGIIAVNDRSSGEIVFRARVGGGLSTLPRFSRDLGIIIRPPEVVEVCFAIASALRDQALQRHERSGPSFTVDESEVDGLQRRIEQIVGVALGRARPEVDQTQKDRSHLGIHKQHKQGLYYLGLSIRGGRTSSADLHKLAHWALDCGGRIRTTNTQNLILLDIPERALLPLTAKVKSAGFDYEPAWASRGMLACTGTQFCKQALTETKERAAGLASRLENQIDLDEPIRISVTGCPNSCGQHRICDVGLEGSSTTIDGIKQEAFQVFLGGGVGDFESISRRVGPRIPADRLEQSLVALFAQYKNLRGRQESFQEFCRRHSDAALACFLCPPDLPSPRGLQPLLDMTPGS